MSNVVLQCTVFLVLSSFTVVARPGSGGAGRWRSVPYVGHYGDPGVAHHGGHAHVRRQDHGHSHGWGSGGFIPLPVGGKATYIQKLIPLFQLGSGLTNFLRSRSSHKSSSWHGDDGHSGHGHGSIWSESGHPHPVPVRHNDW